MNAFLLFASERYGIPVLQPLAQALRRAGHAPYWFGGGKLRGTHMDGAQTLDSIAAVRALRPRAVFVASNSVPHFLPGAKVQLFHGFNVEKRDGSRGHFRVRGLFDLYCTQGPATTAPFARLAQELGHFAVVETGWTKLDPLFTPVPDDFASAASGRPVVLYATTFTERLSSAPALYAQIEKLVARGDRYWLLSLHPKCPRELIERYRALIGPHARFVEPEELVRAERAAQLLVCDTSSVIAECVVQGKPVVTFRNRAPQPWMIDISAPPELDAAIERALHVDASTRAALAHEAERIHPWHDGRSSERVIAATEALLEGRLGTLKPKPGNLWRKLQMRWDWRWFGSSN